MGKSHAGEKKAAAVDRRKFLRAAGATLSGFAVVGMPGFGVADGPTGCLAPPFLPPSDTCASGVPYDDFCLTIPGQQEQGDECFPPYDIVSGGDGCLAPYTTAVGDECVAPYGPGAVFGAAGGDVCKTPFRDTAGGGDLCASPFTFTEGGDECGSDGSGDSPEMS